MKKILLAILILLLPTMEALAGDIPESFLQEGVQMFFGEAVFYHPHKENPSIQVSPVKAIRGDVLEGTLQTYENLQIIGNIKIRERGVYLFVYVEESEAAYAFEVTTLDTKTLKLRGVGGDMWERFETYLHEGRYGEARAENRISSVEKRKKNSTTIAVAVALLAGITGGTAAIKKKKK